MMHNRTSPETLTEKSPDAKPDDEITSTGSSELLVHHPEFFFDNMLLVIQVEKLFNVHKCLLAKSGVCLDRFEKLKPEGDEPEEGSSSEHNQAGGCLLWTLLGS
ncbi:unnamed protein product [Rhizoctonia solani]|uniref:BTB domain-containing protein n=1 Tax=Rhizoctonia solani TaxID=456999 RepID=A0A8H2XEL9_9AGAM|nr:unnamed protein product [Rhizoctonia solani]